MTTISVTDRRRQTDNLPWQYPSYLLCWVENSILYWVRVFIPDYFHDYWTFFLLIFTARSVAERGIAKASCPSAVRLSVTLMYRGHIGWNSTKTILRLISITLADPNITDLLQREHHQILAGIEVWWGKLSIFDIYATVSLKRCKIWSKLLLTTNRNTRFRLVPKSITLNDLWARFKVIDSLNAAKMAKYSLVMT